MTGKGRSVAGHLFTRWENHDGKQCGDVSGRRYDESNCFSFWKFPFDRYVTQTGLFIGLDRTSTIRMEQITNRSINLEKSSKSK